MTDTHPLAGPDRPLPLSEGLTGPETPPPHVTPAAALTIATRALHTHAAELAQQLAASSIALYGIADDLDRVRPAIEALREIASVSVVDLASGNVEASDLVRRAVEGCGYLR